MRVNIAPVQVSVLGPLQVEGPAGDLHIGPPAERALLCLLALNADRSVSTSVLIDQLWDDSPPSSAKKGLQGRVSALRNVLPPDSIISDPGGYRLAVDRDAVDLNRFEALL